MEEVVTPAAEAAPAEAPLEQRMTQFLEAKHSDAPASAPDEDSGDVPVDDVEDLEDDLEPEAELDEEDEEGEGEDEEVEEAPEQQKLTRTKRLAMARDEARQERDLAAGKLSEAVDIARRAHEQSQLAHEEAVLYKAEAEDWKAVAMQYLGMLQDNGVYDPHPAELENFQLRQQNRRAQLEQGRIASRIQAEQAAQQEREVQHRVSILREGTQELSRKYGLDYTGLLRAASFEGANTLEGIEEVAKALTQSRRQPRKAAPRSTRLKGGRGRTKAPRSSDPEEARNQEMADFLADKLARGGRLK